MRRPTSKARGVMPDGPWEVNSNEEEGAANFDPNATKFDKALNYTEEKYLLTYIAKAGRKKVYMLGQNP
eukprot:8145367-Alexandrium_andersonii.AAC.1